MPTSNFQPIRLLEPGFWLKFNYLTLKAPRKTASENVVCLCRLLHLLANFSNLQFAYRQTVWTQIRLLKDLSNWTSSIDKIIYYKFQIFKSRNVYDTAQGHGQVPFRIWAHDMVSIVQEGQNSNGECETSCHMSGSIIKRTHLLGKAEESRTLNIKI